MGSGDFHVPSEAGPELPKEEFAGRLPSGVWVEAGVGRGEDASFSF